MLAYDHQSFMNNNYVSANNSHVTDPKHLQCIVEYTNEGRYTPIMFQQSLLNQVATALGLKQIISN